MGKEPTWSAFFSPARLTIFIERTSSGKLRLPTAAAYVERLYVMSHLDQSRAALEAARAIAVDIAKSLPTHIEAASLTRKSKLPFKVLSLRELLIHRISPLASAAVSLYEQRNYLAGIVLTRSVLETVAIAFAVEQNLHKFLRKKDAEAFDRYLMKLLIASGAPDAKHPAMGITGLVNSVNKRIRGFRDAYNALSEYVHPNWSGMLGSFGTIDRANHALHLGMFEQSAAWGSGINALAGSLAEFLRIYAALPPLITELNNHFEAETT